MEVYCNFCNKLTTQIYKCHHCGSDLEEGRKVTNQFENYFCDFKNCNRLLPYKKIVWNINYVYYHLECYEKILKATKTTSSTHKRKKVIVDTDSHGKDAGIDIFSWFFKTKKSVEKKLEPDVKVSGTDWPTTDKIDNAIENLKDKTDIDEIRHLKVVEDMMGLPLSFPGQFARVYKMQDNKNNKNVALRFFTKKKMGSMNRYTNLHEYFESKKDQLNFFTEFIFLKNAVNINVNDKEIKFPIIKMNWIEGPTLEKFLLDHSNKEKIEKLKINFKKIIEEMEQHQIAHGDLHPKNMIITKNCDITLVDYDCLFIKKFEGQVMPEYGDPDCQHPNRKDFTYDHTVDRFSAFVLYFALIILENNPEFSKIRQGEFIFSETDYKNPEKSETFKKINELPSSQIQYFLKTLKTICKNNKPSIEPLSSIIQKSLVIKLGNDKN